MLRISDIEHCGPLQQGLCWVYALVDPRTEEIRYIGSSRSVQERAKAHRFSLSAGMGNWRRELNKTGLEPLVFLVETTTDDHRRRDEARWIETCLLRGANLLNVIIPVEIKSTVKAELDRIEGKVTK